MTTPRPEGRVVAGHQPHYCPWLGYVDKIASVDVFCQIDVIPFDPQLFQHRNRIRAGNAAGEEWLVVPLVAKSGEQLIVDVEIDNHVPWREQHWERIESSYGHAPYFGNYAPFLADLYRREWRRLVDLNEYMLQGLLDFLGIGTRVVRASALGVRLGDGNVLVDVCRALGATNYVSGAGGNCPHLDESALGGAGIAHRVQRFTHPVYPQLHGGFMPRMAVVDLLFNCGPEATRVIRPTG